jgi:hypothetical protein
MGLGLSFITVTRELPKIKCLEGPLPSTADELILSTFGCNLINVLQSKGGVMSLKTIRILTLILIGLPCASWADDQINPLASEGDWVAESHSNSMTDAPDLCIAANPSSGLGIRIDDTGDIQLRLINLSWSLPANVTGSMNFVVNSNKYSFDISANDSTWIAADVTQAQLLPLVKDMETADSMTLKAGSASVTVPLDGSNTALTALLTCADIQSPTSNTGGTNPFSSSGTSQ